MVKGGLEKALAVPAQTIPPFPLRDGGSRSSGKIGGQP